MVKVSHNALQRQYNNYASSGCVASEYVPNVVGGRPKALSNEAELKLKVAVHSLDSCGFSPSLQSIQELANRLRREEKGEECPSLSNRTVKAIISRLQLPCKTVRKGIQTHESKSTEEYENGFYTQLKKLQTSFQFFPENM